MYKNAIHSELKKKHRIYINMKQISTVVNHSSLLCILYIVCASSSLGSLSVNVCALTSYWIKWSFFSSSSLLALLVYRLIRQSQTETQTNTHTYTHPYMLNVNTKYIYIYAYSMNRLCLCAECTFFVCQWLYTPSIRTYTLYS